MSDPRPPWALPYPVPRVRVPKRFETIASVRPTDMARRLAARVRGAGDQVITTGVAATITWDGTPEINEGGLYLASANTRLTIPSTGRVTGLWIVHAGIRWEAHATGRREVNIIQNTGGSGVGVAGSIMSGQSGTEVVSQETLAYVLDPKPGDFFTVDVFQNSGGNLNAQKALFPSVFELIHLW